MAHHFPAIITLAALLLYFLTCVAVMFARGKYGIKAPATTGNADFERVFRVQMNTQENLLLFLPALWLFSIYVSAYWSGIIGLVWVLARVYFALSYTRSASGRSPGFAVALLAFAVLAIGASVGIVTQMMAGL